ncbi:MAG: hypothetical protein JSV61_00200 [Anaerolineales bacterium]|nr:MAG: hypothetical protein JSV61_00200 [Anaerolineales bacterium]
MRENEVGGFVECYSGSVYAEHPTAFYWQGIHLQVQEVIRRWREPGKMFFLVRTAGDELFELTYDEQADLWLIACQ